MTASLHPAAPHHLPPFITAPGETDVLMAVMAVFLVGAVLAVGLLFLRLHTLPERIACWACWPSSRTCTSSGWPACCSP
jgi:Flp pilus assembly protein protease CpaA